MNIVLVSSIRIPQLRKSKRPQLQPSQPSQHSRIRIKVTARAGRALRVDRTAAAASAWAAAPSHGSRRCQTPCGRLCRRRRPHASCPPPCGRQAAKPSNHVREKQELRSAGTFGRANDASAECLSRMPQQKASAECLSRKRGLGVAGAHTTKHAWLSTPSPTSPGLSRSRLSKCSDRETSE